MDENNKKNISIKNNFLILQINLKFNNIPALKHYSNIIIKSINKY